MPRRARDFGETGWAHIIVRGINRENLFYNEEDYERFLSTVERYQRECDFEIAVLCMMSNHVHFLVGRNADVFSRIMKKILVSYGTYYNKKYERVGPVFQDRYRCEAVTDSGYLLSVARYIYQNPLKAGICPAGEYRYTLLDTEGILAEYFESKEKLIEFLNDASTERFMEYDSDGRLCDEDIINLLFGLTGDRNPQYIQKVDKKSRNHLLTELKKHGVSVRTISRITGINRNIVQRA